MRSNFFKPIKKLGLENLVKKLSLANESDFFLRKNEV